MIIIDRISEGIAVAETDEGMIEIDVKMLESDVLEGDVVIFNGNSYSKDYKTTAERKARIIALKKKLAGGK